MIYTKIYEWVFKIRVGKKTPFQKKRPQIDFFTPKFSKQKWEREGEKMSSDFPNWGRHELQDPLLTYFHS